MALQYLQGPGVRILTPIAGAMTILLGHSSWNSYLIIFTYILRRVLNTSAEPYTWREPRLHLDGGPWRRNQYTSCTRFFNLAAPGCSCSGIQML
jgi:hypothetical protein